jgi:hypothetical protein
MFNDLLNELNYRGLLTYAYADDLAIVGKNKRSLIEATKIVEEWTKRNLMKINKKKSGVIYFKRYK